MNNPKEELYYPNPLEHDQLNKTTHLGVGAHPDDLELMAIHGIIEAYNNNNNYFTGVTITDGKQNNESKDQQADTGIKNPNIRIVEQKKAALIGKYLAQFLLNYPSSHLKSKQYRPVIDDLKQIIKETSPDFIYTHNLADKHDTHVAVTLCMVQALQELQLTKMPKLLGCEVWRGLDWISDSYLVKLDVSKHQDLQEKLIKVYQSQIYTGKRYDKAVAGRKRANATFLELREPDQSTQIVFAMDMTALISKPYMDLEDFIDHN